MANTPKWTARQKHEWLQKPLKGKHLKRCQKARIGLLDAEERKAEKQKKTTSAEPTG